MNSWTTDIRNKEWGQNEESSDDMTRENRNEENILRVQMFGTFSMSYGDKPLAMPRLRRNNQFMNLMQAVLYYAENGIGRDWLEDIVFEDRDVENRHNSLRVLIYKAVKKLRELGLPEGRYIYLENGLYHWTSKIKLEVDAVEFDRIYQKAKAAKDEAERLELYLQACFMYRGEFLADCAGVVWIGCEAKRYRKEFHDAVAQSAILLKKREEWLRLEKLGKFAAVAAPFSDWEMLIMEALIETGRFDEARRLYEETADYYQREQGIYPSAQMMQAMERLGNQMLHSYELLDTIQKKLKEESEDTPDGGYYCSYPVFQGIYQVVNRIMERGGQAVYLMLCTLVDGKGNPLQKEERLEDYSEKLRVAICKSVRHGDIVNQFGRGQYLVLLINTTRENCEIVQNRIDRNFDTGNHRVKVHYRVNSVECEW